MHPHQAKDISAPFVMHPLNTIGYKVSPPIPKRSFAQWSFFYLISGEVLMEIENQASLICEHDCVIVPPGVPFAIKYYNNSIGYGGGFDENILKDRSFRLLQISECVKIHIPDEEKSFMDELFAKIFRQKTHLNIVASALDILLQELDTRLPTGQKSGNTISNQFLELVFDRNAEIRNVAEYAEMLKISADHLNRTVKMHTGKNTGEWIDISRLSLAKILLKDKKIPIIDIAARVGLHDQSYFARFFKKQTGTTPSEFRNSIDDSKPISEKS